MNPALWLLYWALAGSPLSYAEQAILEVDLREHRAWYA
jgi:hypothetical protein